MAGRARLAGLAGEARQCRNRFWPECDTCCYKQQCGQQRAAEGADRRAVTLTSACDDLGMPNMGVIFTKIWAHLIPHVKSATRFRIFTLSLRQAYTAR